MSDFRRALELDENFTRAKEGLQIAQKRQKQAQKRDYYKILGVRRNANKRTINKAYRKLAQKWHPDNFQDEDEKKAAEKKFMDIAAAKEVLSDDGMPLRIVFAFEGENVSPLFMLQRCVENSTPARIPWTPRPNRVVVDTPSTSMGIHSEEEEEVRSSSSFTSTDLRYVVRPELVCYHVVTIPLLSSVRRELNYRSRS